MPTAAQLQQALLKQAIPDIQAVAKEWAAAELELPVVFLVDCCDQFGRGFVEAYIPPEEEYKQKAIRDGGMRADVVATVIKAMPIEWADSILSRMSTKEGQSLREVAEPGQIIVMVVAFGLVKPYHVKAE